MSKRDAERIEEHTGKDPEDMTDAELERAMDELNIDVHNRQPKTLEELDEGYFDLIVTLSPTAHHVALEMAHVDATEVEYWPSADPTVVQGSREQMLDAYRDVRDRLLDRIMERFGEDDSRAWKGPG